MQEHVWNLFAWYFTVLGINSFALSINTRMFYNSIKKPFLSPPGWVYAIVWNILFVLYGISAWFVWKEGGWNDKISELILFLCLMISLPIWSFLFFQFRLIIISSVYIIFIVLILQIIVCIFFFIDNTVSGILNIPGLIWIIFASYLNISIAYLNCMECDKKNFTYSKKYNNNCGCNKKHIGVNKYCNNKYHINNDILKI